MSTLVSSKTTAEANHQSIRVDALKERHHTSRIALVAKPGLSKLLTDIVDKLVLQSQTSVPNLFIGHVIDSMPDLLIALIAHKCRIEVFVIELTPLCCRPCGEVHSIGDIANVILLRIVTSPNRCKHLLAYPAMELTHAVYFLARVASKDTHAEALVVILRILTAHTDELIPRDTQTCRIVTHVLTEEGLIEIVMPSRNWCMNSIQRRSAYELHSLVEGQTAINIVDQTLEIAESSVSLIAMIDLLFDAEFLQRQNTANTQKDLLLQTVLPVTTIERVCDWLVKL